MKIVIVDNPFELMITLAGHNRFFLVDITAEKNKRHPNAAQISVTLLNITVTGKQKKLNKKMQAKIKEQQKRITK